MRIIQTFWSKPFLTEDTDIQNRFKGGWVTKKTNYIATAYSCLQFKKFYNEVELYTDSFGKELLIDKLKLPYTKVHITLDDFNYNPKLWALPKIHTYSLQNKPFIHADNDVIIFDKFDNNISKANLIAQNLCVNFVSLFKMMREVYTRFRSIDTYLDFDYKSNKDELIFANCGIIGGNNWRFFKEYSERAFTMISENENLLDFVTCNMMPQVYEEYLFYCMAKDNGLELLLNPYHFDFDESIVNIDSNYIHVIGFFKHNLDLCKNIEQMFKRDYPEKYKEILDVI